MGFHGEDAPGRRLQGYRRGNREVGQEAYGTHQGLRHGQRATPHWRPRDGAHRQVSYDVANRGASIRIPRQAEADGKGYFEDRRPASNMDPYVVTSKIFQTTCLD